MNRDEAPQIQAEAARALADWKSLFAEEVAAKAKELAKRSGSPGLVRLEHYREAATLAVKVLSTAIQDTGIHDGRQEAA